MSVGKPLHLRLFLEGIEVPIISAAVNIGVNAPSACAIQVVPLDEVMALKPRTLVHVFYLDAKATRLPDGTVAGGLDEAYRLLFAGEFTGFSTILTPQSRAVVLQCVDFSSYWDSAHATAIEYGPGGNAFTNSGSISGGDSAGLFDDIADQQSNVILDWLKQSPLTPGLETVSGLAGGIIRMMEAIGGVIPHHKGINDFFTVAELRVRLLNQITAEEADYTAANIMSGQVFDTWLKTGLQNIGQQVTFRDMMMLLLRYIYYDFVPNPAAMFTDAVTTKLTTQGPTLTAHSLPQAIATRDKLEEALGVAIELSVSGEAGADTKRAALQIVNILFDVEKMLTDLLAFDARLSQFVTTVRNSVIKAEVRTKSVLLDPNQVLPSSSLEEVEALLRGAIKTVATSNVKLKQNDTTTTQVKGQRLRSHIVRPDCWFAPPPTCNVIFPEQFSQVSYDRNLVAEVTRLYVGIFGSLVGHDATIDRDMVVAPNNGFDLSALIKATGIDQYHLLFDHEIHTGIIPRAEWLPDTATAGSSSTNPNAKTSKGKRLEWVDRIALFHFFKYRFATRQMQVAGRFNPTLVCGFPAAVIRRPFIVNDASLLEFKEASGASVDLDSAQASFDFIQQNAKQLGAPVQFIGMMTSLQHNISQDGGSTVAVMSHARAHSGVDDDFVQVFLQQQQGKVKRLIKTSYVFENIKNDPILLKYLASLTPQHVAAPPATTTSQKSLSQVGVSQARASRRPSDPTSTMVGSVFTTVLEGDPFTSPSAAPPFTAFGKIQQAGLENVLVPSPQGASFSKKGRYGGKIIGVQVLNGGNIASESTKFGRVFSSVIVFEEVDVPVEQDIPLEQVMRPPWFSAKYDNRAIGEQIYQKFFGCGSIIDTIITSGLEKTPEASSTDATGLSVSADVKPEQLTAALVLQETTKVSVTIEKALNTISYLYGQVKQQGLDVDEFIRQINDRPIATLGDMFGANLDYQISPDGTAVAVGADPSSDFKIGFHSAAIHPKLVDAGRLIGLLADPTTKLSLINNTGKKEAIPVRYDVRNPKRQRVLDYLAAFSTTRGFRG